VAVVVGSAQAAKIVVAIANPTIAFSVLERRIGLPPG